MKKITPLIIVLLFIQTSISQTLKYSTTENIVDLNSVACEQQTDIVSDNTFYRSFILSDFGIIGDYDITSVDYGIEIMSGAPVEGYPVKVSIYSTDSTFPTGNLTLLSEVTEMITNQHLQMHSTTITATIPSGAEFVVSVSIESDVIADGGNGEVSFQIGSNSDGEIRPSYLKAPACSLPTPVTFASMGRPDIHIVMNVKGIGDTAGIEDLQLVGFSYYPNPVKEKLMMNAKENISSVSFYNILGQEVKNINPRNLNAELDLTLLPSGTYLIRAFVDEKMGSFKVIKD
ncbi:MAG: T9SS type A sorting domain-containing protein [Aureibaculum sp.]|nr:T9SS type A sorting domain-containing protein [Aureibaculum sp.]